MPPAPHLASEAAGFIFTWDLRTDRAELRACAEKALIWSGSLLPLFSVAAGDGRFRAVPATVDIARSELAPDAATLCLRWAELGKGSLRVTLVDGAVRFDELAVTWQSPSPPALRALYFGASILTLAQRAGAPNLDQPFWPDWRAEGFCVPSAKTNPIQSFFRSWDFGRADIPLGSFGPAMGAPYAAAFPRPVYAAALGGRHGWICLGAGEVPDAALTLNVRARSGMLEWLYREDLWAAPADRTRRWLNPLWLAWAPTAWQAYRDFFRLFPAPAAGCVRAPKSFWGTWGDFRLNRFELRAAVDRAAHEMEADLICFDDPWESSKGSGRPDVQKFPNFDADVHHAHKRGLAVGLWLPMGWIADYAAAGLSSGDLLLSRDGVPVRSNWAVDPRDETLGNFCLDPSTDGARRFLRERTHRIIEAYRPSLLKIDFGYGLPGPDACGPRDPACRGERLAWTYARLIAEAAHEIDPAIGLLYYSIHPLWDAVQDQCALDDLGDAGTHEAAGHGQWSIWAALAAERGMPLLASSGYMWQADTENLLNSAVLGTPGANLPSSLADGSPLPVVNLARRRALFRWHRRTSRWTPLWLDSTPGDLEDEPTTRNWGRLETINSRAAPDVTALALREPSTAVLAAPALRGLEWTGRWIVLAQGNDSIFDAAEVALIPLTPGSLALPRSRQPKWLQLVFSDHQDTFSAWSWQEGKVCLNITDTLAGQPLLGLLVID